MIFTVEIKSGSEPGSEIVEIFVDHEGYEDLLRTVMRLKPNDHEHYFTEDWGGQPLTQVPCGEGNRIVNMMTINRLGGPSQTGGE